jgi:hypothetical protein
MKITAAHTAVVEGNDDLTFVSIDADSTARRPTGVAVLRAGSRPAGRGLVDVAALPVVRKR